MGVLLIGAALAYAGVRLARPAHRRAPARVGGFVAEGLSCAGRAGADRSCGASGDVDCCERRAVPGGTFARSYDAVGCTDRSHPATVSSFALDIFEVTVGRFRAFVTAGQGTRASPPAPGSAEHPKIPGSGWDPAWNTELTPDTASLERELHCNRDLADWTDAPGDHEQLPLNCVTFYEAFAFCAWDGGRLPTEAEWNYAAAGGDEQRVYPWSTPPASQAIDDRYAVYSQPRARPVGSKSPLGDARWGQADMSGNVWEWTLDTADPGRLLPTEGSNLCPPAGYLDPCVDCASLDAGSSRVVRSGGYGLPRQGVAASVRRASPPTSRFQVFGVRCAHDRGTAQDAGERPDACVPLCVDRACGPDGCGGTCGACPGGAACGKSGRCEDPSYPSGPRGCGKGEVIPDFELMGFVDPSTSLARMAPIRLGDFHNATGRDAYPPDSPFGAGAPRPRALLIHFGAIWSADARAEAGARLGALHARTRPRGGEILSLLMEGSRHGQSADSYNVIEWARAGALAYPTVMDPERLVERCEKDFPAMAAVDTRTMRIAETGAVPAAMDDVIRAYEALVAPTGAVSPPP
jgi:formylglycine-generating enzyme required for sulfatase activity